MTQLSRRILAETLGTAFLLATVVGSGIMAERLSGGNVALALLCNAIATGAALVVLITIFGPVSGAHFNPAVSLAFAARRELSWSDCCAYTIAQIIGAIIGVWAAHFMFDLQIFQLSTKIRTGAGQWFSEMVATLGLGLTIFGCIATMRSFVPVAVGLYITAAYWFTASTSFANPAVTLARSLSNTFAGIAPANIFAFAVAQIVGMALAVMIANILWTHANESERNR